MSSRVVFEDLSRPPSTYEFAITLEESPHDLERLVSYLRASAIPSAHRLAETCERAREGLEERRRERVACVKCNAETTA